MAGRTHVLAHVPSPCPRAGGERARHRTLVPPIRPRGQISAAEEVEGEETDRPRGLSFASLLADSRRKRPAGERQGQTETQASRLNLTGPYHAPSAAPW